jgi:hypothetical protein
MFVFSDTTNQLKVETKAGMASNGFDSTHLFGVLEDEPNLTPFLRRLFKEVGRVRTSVCVVS